MMNEILRECAALCYAGNYPQIYATNSDYRDTNLILYCAAVLASGGGYMDITSKSDKIMRNK